MARVTYGESITEYAGSIGGVTFLRNASGPIAKLRSNPPVNPSPAQSTYQTNMATLVAFWSTLSQDDKDAWDAWSIPHKHTTPWGVEKTLSGYQWFLSCNLVRLIYNPTPLSSPPAWTAFSPPQSFTLVATETYLRVEWASTYTPDGNLRFFLTLPLRQSSINLRRSLFYVWFIYTPAPHDNIVLTSYFEALANVTWASFYDSANCSVICRITDGAVLSGLSSAFTSDIVKIG